MTTGESSTADGGAAAAGPSRVPLSVLAWVWVGVPMAYGLYELAHKAAQLFTG
ncbi:MFS transporter small subunit [Streptomyces albidus (ex Kaewkla and Franco 2022)]|uniref:MFS transporter small subunit n=1 Tax=Streptomyces albidus (ex Kaewkla and Franco 2022) TaxID=722709 RepID=UPI0015EF395D|nr:hypothetical protein [Streptomyces albidus (ex Kaewkla and Franco 2022)]